MLTTVANKKKIIAIILIFTFAALAEDSNEIDISQMNQGNPFAQLIAVQSPQVVAQEPKPELFVETVTLKFLDAKSIKTSITNMSSTYGSMEPDAKSNSLIVCDTNENLPKIIGQIRKIDRKPEQIMIEVVILDVKLDNETEIGVNWDLLTTGDHDAVFRQNLGFTNRLGSTIRSPERVGDATAFNTTNTGSDLWILWPYDIRTVIHLLQQKNNVEILASPRVMVVSGKTASIEAVEEIPYEEVQEASGGGQLTNVQFKNVGVVLNVGATLTDDRFILLNVESEQKVSTGTSTVSSVPIVDARTVKSSLLLEDGQILVIGGLRRKDTQKQTEQLPFLGDLPIIGNAFKATNTVQNNSELLIILSPHIYNGEKPAELEMQKFNEITQRPLLTIPEVEELKQQQEKEKAKKEAEAEKIKEKEAKKEKQKREKLAKKQLK